MSIKDEECLFLPRCGAAVGDPGEVVSRPPTLGEHTDRLLADLGYDAEAIAALREGGII
jgi:crotonobetainyl-CoA:carnitine CoA-transferase CaiB-like acyl-CoA transferase